MGSIFQPKYLANYSKVGNSDDLTGYLLRLLVAISIIYVPWAQNKHNLPECFTVFARSMEVFNAHVSTLENNIYALPIAKLENAKTPNGIVGHSAITYSMTQTGKVILEFTP